MGSCIEGVAWGGVRMGSCTEGIAWGGEDGELY